LINKDGVIVKGKFPVSANKVCRADAAGHALYAAHCGGGNTGSIGVSLCGMAGFKNRQFVGAYPLTKTQCEAAFKLIAELAKEYNIQITPQTVMTHYEFGKANPNTSSKGKIDIVYLPPYPEIAQENVGDFIRNKAKWYYSKI
jgi:N-acetyl-anhydromuramyl-L-alanine amidase AmpD